MTDERSRDGFVLDERSCDGFVLDEPCADIGLDGRPCAGIAVDALDRCAGIALEAVDEGRVVGELGDGGYGDGAPLDGPDASADDGRTAGRTVVDVASGPPTVVGSAFRGADRWPPRAVGISSGTRTLVAVASPMGPL